MRLIRKHIARSFALLLLIAAGVVLAQMHDTVHLAEDMVVSAGHHDGTSDQKSDHEECLNCIITIVSAELPFTLCAPDYSSEMLKSESAFTVVSAVSPAWFLLRAPPAA